MAIKYTSPIDMTGNKVLNLGTPTAGTDAVNKSYVDGAITGLQWKASVRAAATTNVTVATPGANVDGVALTNGDRVLLMGQTDPIENGIYVFNGAASALTRSTDADTNSEVRGGMAVSVEEGTAGQADKTFILMSDNPLVVGTDPLVFTFLGGGLPYTGGGGLTLTGQDFAVGAGTGVVVNANDVAIDTTVVGRKATFTIGDGAATTFTLTHNLNNRFVTVEVITNSGAYDTVIADVTRPTVNTVAVNFGLAPANNEYVVEVVG